MKLLCLVLADLVVQPHEQVFSRDLTTADICSVEAALECTGKHLNSETAFAFYTQTHHAIL